MQDPCSHPRTIQISGKTGDSFNLRWPKGSKKRPIEDGYVPEGLGLGDGDYIEMEICLDCKQVIGLADAATFLKAKK